MVFKCFPPPPPPQNNINQTLSNNLIIQGDNLDALKSLLPFYAGSIKCIFIDPPYNTGSAFSHYDDNLEHSLWLSMMYPRLELLHELLAEDGSIWITLDDNESHYCKVMMDEIFGRGNFVANVVWQKRTSPDNRLRLGDAHDNILVYKKNKNLYKESFNQVSLSEKRLKEFKNPDNDPHGAWASTDCTAQAGHGVSSQFYTLTTPAGRVIELPDNLCWRFTQERMQEEIKAGRIWFGKDGLGVPRKKTYLSEIQGQNSWTWWTNDETGHNQEAKKEVKLFNGKEIFVTPKPERLIQRILQIATNENDLVLDSFLGSGTTAAVAHKMNRRYIGIEIGEHAKTHVVPRLKKVIDGEQGGISQAVGWQGGGSFRFCELGVPVFDRHGSLNPEIKFADLAAYIWFLQTHTPFTFSDGLQPQTPLIGVHENTAFYLLYNGILGDKRPQGGNVLTRKVLAELPGLDDFVAQGRQIVVYGEARLVGDEALRQKRITFKQIPYHVTGK